MDILVLILIGLAGGLLSGFFGVGGGVIMVPLMVFFLHLSQKEAQGTTLALLTLPVAFMGAYNYYKQGNANLKVALFMAIGFVAGVYLSSKAANSLPETLRMGSMVIEQPMKKAFALLMIAVAVYILLLKK